MGRVFGTQRTGSQGGLTLTSPMKESLRPEAREAGRTLGEHDYSFDAAFTPVLKRAIRTLWIVLDEMDLMWATVYRSWRLDERHYGALQGLNEAEMAASVDRLLPCWKTVLAPALKAGNHIMISAHGNSRRALIKYIDSIGDDDIANLNIPTAIPIVYEVDQEGYGALSLGSLRWSTCHVFYRREASFIKEPA